MQWEPEKCPKIFETTGMTSDLLFHQCNLLYALEIIMIPVINNKYMAGCKSYLIYLHPDYKNWKDFHNLSSKFEFL